MLRRAAWGVDLTGGAVQAVHVERVGSGYRVIDVIEQAYSSPGDASEPLRAHLPDGCDRALSELLNNRQAALADPVFVALPSFGARNGWIELQISDAAKAAPLLDFELHQALGGDLEAWVVRVGSLRRTAAGYAAPYFAQRRELVASFLNDVRRVGLPVDGLVPGPIALARYARTEWPESGCQLVLQVQRTRTDFVYVTPERTRFRSMPLGSGGLKEPELLPRSPQKDFDELAGRLVREHLAVRHALFGDKDGTALVKVHLLGEGARHPELRAALAELLHTDVSVPHAGRAVEVMHGQHPSQTARVLRLGTALGLALGALEPEGDEASLVPPPEGRRAQRRVPALTAAMLIVAVGLLLLRVLVARDLDRDRRELARMKELVPWGAGDDWEEARRSATADAARVDELAKKATALRRQVTFPARLLDSMKKRNVNARLVSLNVTAGVDHDDGELRFEIPGETKGAFDASGARKTALEIMKAHLEANAGVTVVSSEATVADDGTLAAVLKITVNTTGETP